MENTCLYRIFSRLFDTVQKSTLLKFIIKKKERKKENKIT